ncbi:MAG: amino-acid N-acetyltransferase, partial [Gallionellales bacterium RBG_16_56_9]
TFVITFGGEAVSDPAFAGLIHDIALLNSLGVRLVLVYGTRPQIEERLRARGAEIRYVNGLRVTDAEALACVKEAAGAVRVEIEALLSMGLANSPMAGARIRVASGNFVTAKPLGIREGVDYCHTGEVRRIDAEGIRQRLADESVVLLSPLGYSPTGDIFNLTATEVAPAAAIALKADKLISFIETAGLADAHRSLLRQLTLPAAQQLLGKSGSLKEEAAFHLQGAVTACQNGVRRAHLLNRHIDGALLLELFTRDGIGTMINADIYEGTRCATIDDVGGLLELIKPLEEAGILEPRSRERLEIDVEHFTIVERDGMIIACAALHPFPEKKAAELACFTVHPEYQDMGYGTALIQHLENEAALTGIKHLFVLTTRTSHWFRERGFRPGALQDLPVARRKLYNYQRNSKVYLKEI